MVSTFDDTEALLARIGRKTIFFVAGSMKSGTTWLQILLDAHPAISCSGEGHFVDRLAPAIQTALDDYNRHIVWKNTQGIGDLPGYPLFAEPDLAFVIRTAALLLLARQAGAREVAAIGEKTPDNILGLPFLDRLFPEARFIVLVRDGRDCAVSGWFHNQRLSGDWLKTEYPTLGAYAAVTAKGWAKEQESAVSFAQTRPGRCLFLRYEDMIADTAACLARALDFLGIAADAPTLAACCAKGAFAELAGGRARGQEDRGSFYRKGEVGDWRNHFDAATNAAFIREAGPWLTHFGYA